MSDLDEGRDLHASFGTLLADEPAAPWSVSDDVTRGRALQRRRRTRAGAGIGLAAAVVMVFGVFGPWRPKPAAVVPPASPSVELEQQVTDALADLGWETDGVARVRTEPGSPEVRAWTVHRADGDTGVKAKLVLRIWDASSFPDGSVPGGRLIAACSEAGACGMVDSLIQDCSGGPCWTSASTAVQQQYEALPVGSAIVSSWSLSPRAAAEIASTPPASDGTSPDPLETAAFLAQSEQNRLLDIAQRWLVEQSARGVVSSPTPTPTSTASDDAVTRRLEGYGFRVLSAYTGTNADGGRTRSYNVDIDTSADNPVTAFLRLTTYPGSRLPIGAERVDVDGTVLVGCTATTCTPVLPINVPCPSASCFQYWTATTTEASSIGANTLALFTSDGTDGAEAVVGPGNCLTCGGGPFLRDPFLTLEQAEDVLGVFTRSTGPAPTSSGSATPGPTSLADQVALARQIPCVPSQLAAGLNGRDGATGTTVWTFDVRNTSTKPCGLVDPATVTFPGLDLTYQLVRRSQKFQAAVSEPVVLLQAGQATTFVMTTFRCDFGVGPTTVPMQLAINGNALAVDTPPSVAQCTGQPAPDPGNTVTVYGWGPVT